MANIHFVLGGLGLGGFFPGRCVVFEDSRAGIEAVRRAGMKAVALSTPPQTEAFAGNPAVLRVVRDFTRLEPVPLLAEAHGNRDGGQRSSGGSKIMAGKSRWEKRKVDCEESKRENELLVEWRETEDGKKELGSASCDDPKLTDYDGAGCDWTCVDEIEGGKTGKGKKKGSGS